MAERKCTVCDTINDADARFCRTCDNYLGWDSGGSTLDGAALTGTVPTIVGSVPADPPPLPAAAAAASPAASTPPAPAPGPAAHVPAWVTIAQPELIVTHDAAAALEITVENATSIVDGYVIEAVDPPPWLSLEHTEVNLMPGEERGVAVALGLRDETMVVAQRVPLSLVVRSIEDPGRQASASIVVTIPPHGPPPMLEAQPTLIRLDDAGSGDFVLRLDNRAANYPQTVGLSGSDPEGVVSFVFTPQVVEIPPGTMVEVAVGFTAPQPPPGQQLNRQLTVKATNDERTITTALTLVQSTPAAPVDAPIRVQVQPSSIRLTDSTDADFEVHVDNRGGHTGVTVSLSGRDAEQRLTFAFAPARFLAAPGHVTRAHGRVRAHLPQRGSSATHPFTVIASDGTTDVETSASLEIETSAAAMATAEVRAHPERLDIGTREEGEFSIEVDNRRSSQPLNVVLAGRSDDGLVRARFIPPRLTVAPGSVGHARMSVSSPHPRPRQIGVRRLAILVSDGSQRLTATAELTQTGPDRRRPAGRWLVVIGALLVIIGALKWTLDVDFVFGEVAVTDLTGPTTELSKKVTTAETLFRIALVLLGVGMLFGLAGKGGLTRKLAILAVLFSMAYVVSPVVEDEVKLTGLELGIPMVVAGAVLAYVGGILLRAPD